MSALTQYDPSQPDGWSVACHGVFYDALLCYVAQLWQETLPEYARRDCLAQVQYAANQHVELQRSLNESDYQGKNQDHARSERFYEECLVFEGEASTRCFVIEGVVFPPQPRALEYDVSQLFASMRHIVFKNCQFHCDRVLTGVETYSVGFEGCTFHGPWRHDFDQRHVQYTALYHHCTFKQAAIINNCSVYYFAELFSQCTIKTLHLTNTEIEGRMFALGEQDISAVENLYVYDSTLQAPLDLSLNHFAELDLVESVFKGDVLLNDCRVENLKVHRTRFEQATVLTQTKIPRFTNVSVEYYGFAVFEGAELGRADNPVEDAAVTLENVTFHHVGNFRDAAFLEQLDLRNTSFLQTPTFLGCRFNDNTQRQTDRETFRIIKHAFTRVGNHIEANRFYAYEMEAYRRELTQAPNKNAAIRWELALITVNYWLSNHGQSYVRPAIWIGCTASLLALVNAWGELLWNSMPASIQSPVTHIEQVLNTFANGIIILRPLLKSYPSHEFVALVVSLLLSTCAWQFLIAIRRHKQR